MSTRTAVVGGSIAGCAVAIAASQAGHEVTVYERSTDTLADRGFGITIPPGLHEELAAAGFLGADLRVCRLRSRIWMSGPEAKVLWCQPSEVTTTNWGLLWESLRGHVRDADYHVGKRVRAVRTKPHGGAAVVCDDGAGEPYDLVVGADGYRSVVRQALVPHARPGYAGYCLWRASLPLERTPGADHVRETLREAYLTVGFPGGHGIFYPIPSADGGLRLNWAVYATPPATAVFDTGGSYPPGRVPAGLDTYAATLAAAYFPAPWRDAVRATPLTQVALQPVHDLPLPRTARPPLALAGDAATLIRPHTASGAVKALQDAVAIGAALRSADSLAAALDRYDRDRTSAGNALVDLGRDIGRAQVEDTPHWAAMGPPEVRAWIRRTIGDRSHYLYTPHSHQHA